MDFHKIFDTADPDNQFGPFLLAIIIASISRLL